MKAACSPDDLLAVARRICAARDWRLLQYQDLNIGLAEFGRRMAATIQQWREVERRQSNADELIEQTVVHEYCKLLYEAVGRRDTNAGARAMIEVWNYVTPLIRKTLRDDDLAQDVGMDTLLKVCEKRDTVRDPGSFLAWCAVIAYREAIRTAEAHKLEITMTDLGFTDDADIEELDTRVSVHSQERPTADLDQAVWLAELEARIRACLHRMRHGAEVFIDLVLHELPTLDIAQRLELKPGAVYVIFHRARKRLQRCRQLLTDLADALGATP